MCIKIFELNPGKYYIDMNTELRQKAKNNVEKDFFKLMNNAVFGKLRKMWENIEILNLFISEPNYHTTRIFTESLLAIEIKKLKY